MRIRLLIHLTALLTISASHLAASQVRSLNLEQLTQKAGRIVSGRCSDVSFSTDPELGIQVTTVTLDVQETLKGAPQGVLTFRMAGGGGGAVADAGVPTFKSGEVVLLFLYPESRAGLTSPVGFGQGKFLSHRDKQGRIIFLNGHGNTGLFDHLSAPGLGRIGPRTAQRGPVLRDELFQMIRALSGRASR